MEPTDFGTKPAPMGRWKRLFKIFTAPNEVFEAILEKPTMWMPVIITFVISLLATLATKDYMQEVAMMTLKAKGMDEAQASQMLEATKTIQQVSLYLGVVAAGLIPILKGGVTHVIAMLMGGKATVNETLGVICHTYLIQSLGVILAVPVILMTGNPLFTFSAGIFFSAADMGSALYLMMNYINLFLIWYLVVSIIGVKKVHELSWMKASLAVLLPFIVMVGMTLAPYLTGNM